MTANTHGICLTEQADQEAVLLAKVAISGEQKQREDMVGELVEDRAEAFVKTSKSKLGLRP